MENCTHTRYEDGYWSQPYQEEHPITGEMEMKIDWVEGEKVRTVVDIDIDRYQCTQCGKIMYYSHSARLKYEGGS